ncbi:MAG: hypothetical protein HQM16_12360 [Deltaproteobacteria bacterium]|nr:hypothetical protein [Deltaproteobacteria bacterium]
MHCRNVLILICFLCLSPLGSRGVHAEGLDTDLCTYDGIPLYGAVEVDEYFGDFTVEIVDSFPDLYIEVVDMFADECGEWEFVESFGDFSVTFVEYFGDITIEYVDSFPGIGYGTDTVDDDPPENCGDNYEDVDEECDDGNTTDGDGCSSYCVDETGSGTYTSYGSGSSDSSALFCALNNNASEGFTLGPLAVIISFLCLVFVVRAAANVKKT